MALRKSLADLARRALKTAGFRAVAREIRGAPVQIPVDMGELRSLIFNPTYSPFFNEDEVMNVLETKLRPADIVFDVGAYCGVWAMLLARHAREVVAFEPNPGTFEVLQETIAVNRARNVSACAVAIGEESREADFWGTGSGASLQPGEHNPRRTRVQLDTLDHVAKTHSRLPDVLKIDVEGAEQQVLSGAPHCLAHARVVCIELHLEELPKFGGSPAKVADLMTRAGFVEIARSTPARLGSEDPSRLHVIYERQSEAR